MISKWSLTIPGILVATIIWNLGDPRPAYVIDGELVVIAIVLFFGLWLIGYFSK